MMDRASKRPFDDSRDIDMAQSSRELPPQSLKQARSCRSCHRRKIRCDRGVPCMNCSRHGIPCVYPTKDSHVARKTPTLQDISNCLERLEPLLLRFVESSEVTSKFAASGGAGSSGGESQTRVRTHSGAKINENGIANLNHYHQNPCKSTWELLWDSERNIRANGSSVETSCQAEESIEIAHRNGLNSTSSYLRGNAGTHQRSAAQLDSGTPLDRNFDVLEFYPDAQLALRLWKVYVTSVDPVLKILHIPTVQSTVLATILDPRCASASTVALTFAIYYAATTALCHNDDCEPIDLPWEKPVLLERYRMCLDQLLTLADLTNRPNLMAVQALAIYITSLRANNVGRTVWVLNGLAIRLAQTIDLHRDGANLQLSPFETEMRLRLWWHLCVLDSRAPEDQGFQPAVDVRNGELRLPLNLNDDQIYPEMVRLPTSSNGWTEMSFFLIQAESCRLVRPIADTQGTQAADSLLEIREKRKDIKDPGEYFRRRFGVLPGSEGLTDLQRVAIRHVSTGSEKMLFVLQLREEMTMRKQKETQDDATPDTLKQPFKLACDVLESGHVLLKGGLAPRFNWFFKIYTQWYALTYVLRYLCSIPRGLETERAWVLVDELFPRELSFHGNSAERRDKFDHGSIWSYLDKLRNQALSIRNHARLLVNATEIRSQSFSGDSCHTSQLLLDATMTPLSGSTATAHGTSTLVEFGQEFMSHCSQGATSFLDMSMPDVPFLPDWNAVINASLGNGDREFNY